jgi:hypothetical protein
MNADRRAHVVAVVSGDALLAALLGAATELAGFRASFPQDGGVLEVVRRKRVAALLLDAAHASARDEALLGRALMAGTRIIVFGRATELDALKPLASRYDVIALLLPQELDKLAEILARHHPLVRPRGSV